MLCAAAAVGVGAIGAHAFRDAGDLRGAGLIETAAQYLMWHALGALALIRLPGGFDRPVMVMLASSLVFAGTLVLLALGAPGWLGIVTPFGGAGMIGGWLLAAWTGLRTHRGRAKPRPLAARRS
jgi:uncharacterized membrane protein YgdD (TMEM256/DUF423 family)